MENIESKKYRDCLVIDEKSLEKSKQIMKKTWEDFRDAIARKDFDFDDTNSAMKFVFLKQFNDWFQGIGKKEMSKSFSDYFRNHFVGRGTVIKSEEFYNKPNYERFMPKAEYIKDDNRFSPAGIEWLYLAVGKSRRVIKECAQKECKVRLGDKFWFCEFKLTEQAKELRLVDLTIANHISQR